MTAEVTAAAATLLVLLLAHHTRLQQAAMGYAEAVPVGLLLGLTTAVTAPAVTAPVVTAPPAHAAIVGLVAVIGTAAAVVDAHERRLPNVLTATLGLGLFVVIPAAAFLTRNPDSVLRASAAAAGTAAVAIIAKAVRPTLIGWGDVKLLPSLTATLAWVGLPTLVHGLVLWIVLLLATTAVWRMARLDTTDVDSDVQRQRRAGTSTGTRCPTARRWCSAPWVRCWS